MDQSQATLDLTKDPNYLKLVEHYQHAELEKCRDILDSLLLRYPGNIKLLEFKKDLDMQLSLKTMSVKHQKVEAQKKRKGTLRLSAFTIISGIVVMAVFAATYLIISNIAEKNRQEQNQITLNSLQNQVEQLILSGQPQTAAQIIEKMRAVDATYSELPELTSDVNQLLALEAKYKSAQDLLAQNEVAQALLIFKEIEAEKPGLWDVQRQITTVETSIEIAKFLEQGNLAYQNGQWDEVITTYESALALDPKLDDPLVKEQLLNGYLKRIIQMLESNTTSVDDIENAEQYYRKAVAMIPQSRAFASERENLRDVSSNLLELKFTQTAQALLEERNQTVSSVAEAVSYLNKAVNLQPKNSGLQMELRNAELYQIAFSNFVEMNWAVAISNLNQLLTIDKTYANGNAAVMLYESYYLLGKRYTSVGLYEDARKNLEQAEILAWEDSANKLKLFQVQVALGEAIGKARDYENAVSYYQYALNLIGAAGRIGGYPSMASKIYEAESLAGTGSYRESFEAYMEGLVDINQVYDESKIAIGDGVCLAFFADQNSSTMEAIINANQLPENIILTFGRELIVPTIR